MDNLTLVKIKTLAEEKYNGDFLTAIAAHLYGEAVVFDCNNQVPIWAEMDKINEIESQIQTLINSSQLPPPANEVSIATEPNGAEQEETEKVEEVKDETTEEKEFKEQTQFSDGELFEIVLDANKSNCTIGEAIARKLYGEKGFDADGSFSGLVNVHKVAFVKGLITQLLNGKTAEKVEEVQPKEETPAEAPQSENTGELKADSEVKSESENAEVKPAI